jgi:signal transduction histidine kinase
VAFESRTYLSLAYVLLRLPLSLIYATIVGLAFSQGNVITALILLVPAALGVWVAVVVERTMARNWFGAPLTPMAPEAAPNRPWRERLTDLLANPVTWKSLAYILIEVPVGFVASVLALGGLVFGVLGTIGFVMGSLVIFVVALTGRGDTIPTPLPFVFAGGLVAGVSVFLGTLHAARLAAQGQIWLVTQMLGMSQTQLALAAARAEAAAERARAESSDRSRRDLVLNVSHELRNPLATIRAHVDTLREEDGVQPSPAERKRYLEVLSRETDRLGSLVEELLTLASADTGQLHLDIGPVDAAAVATQVHEAMAPLAWRERHIRLLCTAETGKEPVMADRGRLAQVLMNLVRNAITQTPEGGLVAIEVKPLDTGPVEMSVSDTGPGIESAESEKIFERFYRTDASRARSTGGFGLGLAIAREMVEAMGGRIRVESAPGQGSRFTVTLGRA